MWTRTLLLAAGIIVSLPSPAHAQASGALLLPRVEFASWTPGSGAEPGVVPSVSAAATRLRPKARSALIGGAIGAVAGLGFCTAVSNIMNDGTGFSTCTLDGYLVTGSVGFVLGAAVGLLF